MIFMRIVPVCLLVAVLAVPADAADVQVIANPGLAVSELTTSDIRDIFLGSKTAIAGSPVEPVLAQAGEAHEAFLKTYLGKSNAALRNYFKTLVFTGKGAQPKTFASDAEVVKYVTSTKGAIGYVSAAANTSGVKKIQLR